MGYLYSSERVNCFANNTFLDLLIWKAFGDGFVFGWVKNIVGEESTSLFLSFTVQSPAGFLFGIVKPFTIQS